MNDKIKNVMPYNIKLDYLPVGITAKTVFEGETVDLITSEFTSSEDGDFFIERLDGIPSDVINLVSKQVIKSPIFYSQIDHLLAVINKDQSATVYINEIPIITEISIKNAGKKKGEVIYRDDIAEILKVRFDKIEIPENAGLVYLFSIGWRKALFFDFSPFSDKFSGKDYDLEILLGQYYSYLEFQSLFKVSELAWENFFTQKWFPFTSLKDLTIKDMIFRASNNLDIDVLDEKISKELIEILPAATERWQTNEFFQDDFPFFTTAVERYLEKDFVSASSILYPRIEGILRKVQSIFNPSLNASQKNLVKTLGESFPKERKIFSSLLPLKFQSYLEEVFFANFDSKNPIEISRHSVSHGVAPFNEFNLKSATIAFLIIDQLYFYLFSAKK